MRAYNVTEFRDKMAEVLDQAATETIIIKRNGKSYELKAAPPLERSGLDVGFVRTAHPVTAESILEDIEAGRERR